MDPGANSYHRFLEGDDKGMEDIVGAYKDGLILYLNGFVNNIYTAEELTEDTFFRLMTKRPKFTGKSSFKTFLYAIGRNLTIDYIRHYSRFPETPIEDREMYLSDMSDLENSYIMEERKVWVHRALEQLRPDYRQIIWLSFFEELPNKEISMIMKKNERQIRNLIYRAKQALKSELGKEGFGYEEF